MLIILMELNNQDYFLGKKENEYQPINNEYEIEADKNLYCIRNNI